MKYKIGDKVKINRHSMASYLELPYGIMGEVIDHNDIERNVGEVLGRLLSHTHPKDISNDLYNCCVTFPKRNKRYGPGGAMNFYLNENVLDKVSEEEYEKEHAHTSWLKKIFRKSIFNIYRR